MNYKTVILYTSLCLLSSSSLTIIYASVADPSPSVSATDEVTSTRLCPRDMLLVPFLQDKTEAELAGIIRRTEIVAKLNKPDVSISLLEVAFAAGIYHLWLPWEKFMNNKVSFK
jgi:hypothetical protein